MIEDKMDFAVTGKIKRITPDSNSIHVEFEDAIIYQSDEKHLIKTFSDATLIEEISRRYDIDLIINKIKE